MRPFVQTFTVLLAVAVAVAGCSGSREAAAPSQTPTQVVDAFMKAQNSNDKTAFNSFLTKKAQESLSSMGDSAGFSEKPLDSYTLGAETITGDEASVDVNTVDAGEPQKAAVKLRQEDGAWRIYGIAMKLNGDSEILMNLENMADALGGAVNSLVGGMAEGLQQSLGDWKEGGSEAEIAAGVALFDALAPISIKDYEAAWKATNDFRGKPRAEALTSLAAPLGLSIALGDNEKILSEPVTIDTRKFSRLHAIEAIANEAKLHSVMPDLSNTSVLQSMVSSIGDALTGLVAGDKAVISAQGPEAEAVMAEAKAKLAVAKATPKDAIRFEPIVPDSQTIFVGPFRIEPVGVEEKPPHATGTLTVMAAAHGVPPAMLAIAQDSGHGISIDAIEDAKGRSLIEPGVTYSNGGQVAGLVFFDQATRDLKNLLRGVEVIKRVPASIALARPVEVIEFDFTTLAPGTQQSKDGYAVTVKQVGASSSFEITGPNKSDDAIPARMQPYKADGSPMGITFNFVNGWNGVTTAELSTPETPARVRIKLVPKLERHEYTFDLGPISLHHFAEMPEKLEELSFAGHDAPIELELMKIVDKQGEFRKTIVRVTNFSNKAPTSAFVDFVYKDASGNDLNSFPHTVSGPFTSEGTQPLAAPGAKAEMEQTAFQMPADATGIEFVVNRVEFVDGTTWEPKN